MNVELSFQNLLEYTKITHPPSGLIIYLIQHGKRVKAKVIKIESLIPEAVRVFYEFEGGFQLNMIINNSDILKGDVKICGAIQKKQKRGRGEE